MFIKINCMSKHNSGTPGADLSKLGMRMTYNLEKNTVWGVTHLYKHRGLLFHESDTNRFNLNQMNPISVLNLDTQAIPHFKYLQKTLIIIPGFAPEQYLFGSR